MNEDIKKPIKLPYIAVSKSLPIIPPIKEFDLRFVNHLMPKYDPVKDKYLHNFFERQDRNKQSIERPKMRHSLKSQPSSIEITKKSPQKPLRRVIQSCKT